MKQTHLAFLTAALLMPTPSAAQRTAVTATAQEIRTYKFGLELGCRDGGARKGDSRDQVDAFCGCVVKTLDRVVTPADWERAARYSFDKRDDESNQVIGPYFQQTATCKTQGAGDPAAAVPASPMPALSGKWTWTRKTNNCTETYDFSADGKALVTSGEEKTVNTYLLAPTADSAVRYQLTMTTKESNGKRDCAGSTDGSVGKSTTGYVFVNYAGDALLMCQAARGPACFGPLLRVTR